MLVSNPLILSESEKAVALVTYLSLWVVAVPLSAAIALASYHLLGYAGPLLVVLAYAPFWFDSSSKMGEGRPMKWLLSSRLVKMWAAYFPMRLVVTHPFPPADVSPKKKYIFAMFPHGTIPLHGILGLASDGCESQRLLPGVDIRTLSVAPNFWLPFWRDLFLAMGAVDSSAEVARRVLQSGRSLLIFPGGVKEMIQTRPGQPYRIVAESRKGFVRLAMESGAEIVPVFAFGATEAIHSHKSPALEKFNSWFAKKFMFFFPVYFGRWYTLVPFKHPINCVVGKPIPVDQTPSPTEEQINHVHRVFLHDLKALFHAHKAEFGGKDDELRVV